MGLFPVLASEHGGEIDRLLLIVLAFITVLFFGWLAFFTVALLRFRKSRNPAADYDGVRNHRTYYVEFGVIAVEVTLLLGFSIPFWIQHVTATPLPDEAPLHVRVIAQQFVWNVHYPGADGVFGRTDAAFVDEQLNPAGIDPDSEEGKDDIVSRNILFLPKGQPVLISLTSKDVVHSFYLPELRVKQDAIPGMAIDLMFTPTMSTLEFQEQTGQPGRRFEIACAQLCGLGHYSMRGFLDVLEPEDFQTWLEENAPSDSDDDWPEF